ncbi:uridine kinase [Legionella wadsworthii]|uniref:Uridine kinase n=1 Tax=Legionella wadsworthii TaxID=28088 RepID=A0A378LLE1_9GAMM|nr:uridine kinase [Legionella wadsworthii]STY27845.1 uridine kinase [Legionella wadsworthii]
MIFIIIGGASASGKTGLSKHLLDKLVQSGVSAQILNMDDYYHERPEHVSINFFRTNTNFDTPDMLHLDLLQEHIGSLYQGMSIKKPIFNFKTNRRNGEEEIHPSDVIIMEGIFAQYFYKKHWSSDMTAVTVNIGTDSYSDIIERRTKRDISQRGRERNECLQQERKYVGPGFLKFTASSSMGADIYINNQHREGLDDQNLVLDAAADEIIAEISKKLKEKTNTNNPSPNAQELIAKSHLMAGTLFQPNKFEGRFNGVFGTYKGDFVKVFSEKEAEELTSSLKV